MCISRHAEQWRWNDWVGEEESIGDYEGIAQTLREEGKDRLCWKTRWSTVLAGQYAGVIYNIPYLIIFGYFQKVGDLHKEDEQVYMLMNMFNEYVT